MTNTTPDLTEIRALYDLPLPELMFRAQTVHRQHHDPAAIQLCTLQSIKTGRCPEDCKYCPQSAHNSTGLQPEPLLDTAEIVASAKLALAGGASRFCMGAAWRDVKDGPQFDSVLASVRGVSDLGLEVCCTLGMLTENQAARLKDAGCDVYNHNLDTSREYYPEIITTRTYDERLDTLAAVRRAGLQVCSGGILGLGEKVDDRLKLLRELASLDPQPDSVPVNALVAVEGTPLENQEPVDPIEFVRVIAVARILMPRSMVRLSAGRREMSPELQALCFMAGANSIFLGERLLTTPNPGRTTDFALLEKLGMRPLAAAEAEAAAHSRGHHHHHHGDHAHGHDHADGQSCCAKTHAAACA